MSLTLAIIGLTPGLTRGSIGVLALLGGVLALLHMLALGSLLAGLTGSDHVIVHPVVLSLAGGRRGGLLIVPLAFPSGCRTRIRL